MIKLLYRSLTAALLCALCACGGADGYVIECDFANLGDHGVVMIATDGRSARRTEIHPRDGRFKAEGSGADPALVELFTLDGRLLYTCAVSDGDRLKVKLNIDSVTRTLRVEGSEPMELMASWIVENDSLLTRGTDAEVNALITSLVSEHPSSTASTLMLVSRFRTRGSELLADSLLNIIDAPARPLALVGAYAAQLGAQLKSEINLPVPGFTLHTGRDTVVSYNPAFHSYSLLMFTDTRKPDSIVKRLRALYKDVPSKRFDMVETSLARDSLSWRVAIDRDTAAWKQGWAPGGPASPRFSRLAINTLPFYVVADSLGRALYRGPSLYEADTLVRSLLNTKISAAEPDSAAATPAVKRTQKEPPAPRRLGPGALQLKKAE